MAVTEIKEFKEEELNELLEFFRMSAPDHPELSEGHISKWQRGYHFISRYKGKIGGYITQIPQIFKYGKSANKTGIENIGWGVTLILDMSNLDQNSSLRRAAITHELLSKCEKNLPLIHCGVGMIPEILETYKRRGMIIRNDCVNMYTRFIKPEKALSYLGKPRYYIHLAKLLNLFINPKRMISDKNISKITKFDSGWDYRWDSLLSDKYEFYGVRTSEYLNYKLSQPNKNYHIYLHHHGGYIIFRIAEHRLKDLKILKVCDLVGLDDIRLDLLKIAQNYAFENNVYAIVALSSKIDCSLYRKVGMYIAKTYLIALRPPITAKMHVSFFDADLDNLW